MIVIVAAMEEEIREIAKAIEPNIHVIVTGVGKVNAAMRLTEVIQKERIEAIVNVGFAGASGSFNVGDVILVRRAQYHDFDLTIFGYDKGQVPGYPTYFEPDQMWVSKIKQMYPHIKEADLLTGDYFMTGEHDLDKLFDMEGAALFQVAHHFQLPIVSIKVVSDVITMDHHLENYKKFEAEEGAHLLYDLYHQLFGGKQ